MVARAVVSVAGTVKGVLSAQRVACKWSGRRSLSCPRKRWSSTASLSSSPELSGGTRARADDTWPPPLSGRGGCCLRRNTADFWPAFVLCGEGRTHAPRIVQIVSGPGVARSGAGRVLCGGRRRGPGTLPKLVTWGCHPPRKGPSSKEQFAGCLAKCGPGVPSAHLADLANGDDTTRWQHTI
jgi:hypothetical protein